MSRYNKLFEKGIFSLHRTILEDELIKELAGYFNVLSDRLAKIKRITLKTCTYEEQYQERLKN